MLKFTISHTNLFVSAQVHILSGREFHSFAEKYLNEFNPLVVGR